jgi:hypothetical protein
MMRHLIKFLGAGLAIVIMGSSALYATRYINDQRDPRRKVERSMKEIEKKYAEDPYGGETPEETLRLFINALKKGDTELAAKYFVLDSQQQWKEDLAKIKEKNLLGDMIRDLEKARLNNIENDLARYYLINEEGYGSPLTLIKIINKWKIRSL